jgi:Ohr subfamily peroxiredoxin
VRHAARRHKVRLGDTSVTARVGIGPNDAGGFELTVELHVRMSDVEPEQAREIADDAHRVCPYSNATRGNIDVKIIVDPEPDVI